jgi:isopenicillin N synthase-like dioxygenase
MDTINLHLPIDQLGHALVQSFRETGFAKLTGVSESLREHIELAHAAAEAFFHNPVSRKESFIRENSARGYTGFGLEHAKDNKYPDLKEFFHIGTKDNVLPREFVTFERFFLDLHFLSVRLLKACAIGCWLPDTTFSKLLSYDDPSILRILHYPALADTKYEAGSLRSAPHEDINLITLLVGASAPGLQVLGTDGSWIDAPLANIDEIIVNVGDMLQNITNGYLKSTTHRVINQNINQARFSMPFFAHPNKESDLTPLPAMIKQTGGAAKYPSITAEQYLNQRLKEIGLK